MNKLILRYCVKFKFTFFFNHYINLCIFFVPKPEKIHYSKDFFFVNMYS